MRKSVGNAECLEKKVMENIVKQGPNVIKAHIAHLKEHNEQKYLEEAYEVLKEKGIDLPRDDNQKKHPPECPGMKAMSFEEKGKDGDGLVQQKSQLRHWPVQLHLISPQAGYYQGRDVLLTADCVAYCLGDYHTTYLKGKSIAIACPKLDQNKEIYIDKIKSMVEEAEINTLTVMIMEVPCCSGLLQMAKDTLFALI